MCYADTLTNDDGTVTACCYCGWSDVYATPELADAAAGQHESRQFDEHDYAATV